MRKFTLFLTCIVILCSAGLLQAGNSIERSIVIVAASYNNAKYCKFNLDSVFAQEYQNYRMIYIDDCSTDDTYDLVKSYIEEKGYSDRVLLIKNRRRCGALANQYAVIQACKDDDVIIILDGDDRFAFDRSTNKYVQVLSYINNVYSNPNIWLTYGQFREWPSGNKGFCCQIPDDIVRRNAFREFTHIPSHLRTFYAGLFKKIKIEDLMHEGSFMQMSGDIATMFPMVEMARDRFRFIDTVLLDYNAANPLNNYKVSKKIERNLDLVIRGKSRYGKISSPFGKE